MNKILKFFKNNTLGVLFLIGALGIIICYCLGFGETAEKTVNLPSGIIVFSVELFLMIALCIFAKTINDLDKMLTMHVWIVVCYGVIILAFSFLGVCHPGINLFAVLGLAIISFFIAWLFLIIFSRNWPDDHSEKKSFY